MGSLARRMGLSSPVTRAVLEAATRSADDRLGPVHLEELLRAAGRSFGPLRIVEPTGHHGKKRFSKLVLSRELLMGYRVLLHQRLGSV